MFALTPAKDGLTATLALNAPSGHRDLPSACEGLPEGVRAVVVTGFAGSPKDAPAALLAGLAVPTVAWVDGDARDHAAELALACDIRVLAPGASMALTQVRAGALPSDGGTQRLVRLVGRAHALRLLLTGDALGADEAAGLGLAQAIGTLADAGALVGRIAAGGPLATAYTREAVRAAGEVPLAEGLRLEADLAILLHTSADRAEGLAAFLERRSPHFEGR
ncbi:MAG: enoyl-CoA hydratase-related protein [Chloroflexota bacterium]